MKIIPTWATASLTRFHQTVFQDCLGRSNPEKPFVKTLEDSLIVM